MKKKYEFKSIDNLLTRLSELEKSVDKCTRDLNQLDWDIWENQKTQRILEDFHEKSEKAITKLLTKTCETSQMILNSHYESVDQITFTKGRQNPDNSSSPLSETCTEVLSHQNRLLEIANSFQPTQVNLLVGLIETLKYERVATFERDANIQKLMTSNSNSGSERSSVKNKWKKVAKSIKAQNQKSL